MIITLSLYYHYCLDDYIKYQIIIRYANREPVNIYGVKLPAAEIMLFF